VGFAFPVISSPIHMACRAYERHALRYLASIASLIGVVCLALDRIFELGFRIWDVALSFSLLFFAAGYGDGGLSVPLSFAASTCCCWQCRRSVPRGAERVAKKTRRGGCETLTFVRWSSTIAPNNLR
jgi:hypothetical protein